MAVRWGFSYVWVGVQVVSAGELIPFLTWVAGNVLEFHALLKRAVYALRPLGDGD